MLSQQLQALWGKATPVGFEHTRGDPIGLAGRRLSRSAKVSDGLAELLADMGGSWAAAILASRSVVKEGRLLPADCASSHAAGNKKASQQCMKATPVGFEPTRGDPIGLAGRRLSRSAKVSHASHAE